MKRANFSGKIFGSVGQNRSFMEYGGRRAQEDRRGRGDISGLLRGRMVNRCPTDTFIYCDVRAGDILAALVCHRLRVNRCPADTSRRYATVSSGLKAINRCLRDSSRRYAAVPRGLKAINRCLQENSRRYAAVTYNLRSHEHSSRRVKMITADYFLNNSEWEPRRNRAIVSDSSSNHIKRKSPSMWHSKHPT